MPGAMRSRGAPRSCGAMRSCDALRCAAWCGCMRCLVRLHALIPWVLVRLCACVSMACVLFGAYRADRGGGRASSHGPAALSPPLRPRCRHRCALCFNICPPNARACCALDSLPESSSLLSARPCFLLPHAALARRRPSLTPSPTDPMPRAVSVVVTPCRECSCLLARVSVVVWEAVG